ncbi:MAG: transposase [Oscillospiraceae bacterium]|nr:transposase [Oscillospiraceae bacterium]
MPRGARKKSESGYYHIVQRGNGKQILFEDDADNRRYLSILQKCRLELGFELAAYCLMENHTHLLLRDNREQLDLIMKKIAVRYALYFNRKYERSGHLFQDRYGSEPVETDAYLLCVIRYIHKNPEKAGVEKADAYPWSSYAAYLSPGPEIDNQTALELLGGSEGFVQFMRGDTDESCLDVEQRRGVRDETARQIIRSTCGIVSGTQMQQWEKKERDAALRKLKAKGLTVRQLERLTGLNRGAIQRA